MAILRVNVSAFLRGGRFSGDHWWPGLGDHRGLFSTRSETTTRIVLGLLYSRDWVNPQEIVRARDSTLRARIGLTGYNWARALKAQDLKELVEIERGTPGVKGRPGTATYYSLEKLWAALEVWRTSPRGTGTNANPPAPPTYQGSN